MFMIEFENLDHKQNITPEGRFSTCSVDQVRHLLKSVLEYFGFSTNHCVLLSIRFWRNQERGVSVKNMVMKERERGTGGGTEKAAAKIHFRTVSVLNLFR